MNVVEIGGGGTSAAWLQLIGTILAALIISVVGAWVTARFTRARDLQDRESQWRQHAVELTRLELERKLETWSVGDKLKIQPVIHDFLAIYRDLQKLNTMSPGELSKQIRAKNTASVTQPHIAPSGHQQPGLHAIGELGEHESG